MMHHRRRARFDYLQCAICKRDLPAEEFRPIKRKLASGEVKLVRHSYCKPCQRDYGNSVARVLYRVDPKRREDARRRSRRYHQREGREPRKAAARRRQQAQEAITHLDALGWNNTRIAEAIGSHRTSIRRWRVGKGKPREHTVERLLGVVGRESEMMTGGNG